MDGDGIIAERFGGRDCDDTNPEIGDCDLDRDGFRDVRVGGDDCDDTNPAVNPAAVEVCGGGDANCNGLVDDDDPEVTGLLTWYRDADGDGYGDPSQVARACEAPEGFVPPRVDPVFGGPLDDCDDTRADVNPGESEYCDEVDHDCDGDVRGPSALPILWFQDLDGDGQGSAAVSVLACEPPQGYVTNALDCDDSNAATFLGAAERCNGRDDNCNGIIDEGAIDSLVLWEDGDQDGWGGVPVLACAVGPFVASRPGDCNDADPLSYPGAPEICGDAFRQDCSALSPYDCDGDGYEDVNFGGDDCDDANAAISPGATELCNGYDDNCNGLVDDADPAVDASDLPDWYFDFDGDGYGIGEPIASQVCSSPGPNAAPRAGDCNDLNPAINPATIWYVDADGDGFGAPFGASAPSCTPPVDGGPWVLMGGDCNDLAADMNPMTPWYRDADGDGVGQAGDVRFQCAQPVGYVRESGDCDDFNPDVLAFRNWYPDRDGDGFGDASADPVPSCIPVALHVPNNADCDDLDPTVVAGSPWYVDADGDGLGAGPAVFFCSPPTGAWSPVWGDCDDTNPNDGSAVWYRDRDLDGFGDDATTLVTCVGEPQPNGYVAVGGDCDDRDGAISGPRDFYRDADGDGYPTSEEFISRCFALPGYVLPRQAFAGSVWDCDDTNALVSPGNLAEVCFNGLDDNCDGSVDGELFEIGFDFIRAGLVYLWRDADGDGLGDRSWVSERCNNAPGWVANDFDCDDSDPDNGDERFPWFIDGDGDGFGAPDDFRLGCGPVYDDESDLYFSADNDDDCDDEDYLTYPGAPEQCNGRDNDCDGVIDNGALRTFYRDADGDLLGDPLDFIQTCDFNPPAGYVDDASDCAPNDSTLPGLVRMAVDPSMDLLTVIRSACATSLTLDLAPGVYAQDLPLTEPGDDRGVLLVGTNPADTHIIGSPSADPSQPMIDFAADRTQAAAISFITLAPSVGRTALRARGASSAYYGLLVLNFAGASPVAAVPAGLDVQGAEVFCTGCSFVGLRSGGGPVALAVGAGADVTLQTATFVDVRAGATATDASVLAVAPGGVLRFGSVDVLGSNQAGNDRTTVLDVYGDLDGSDLRIIATPGAPFRHAARVRDGGSATLVSDPVENYGAGPIVVRGVADAAFNVADSGVLTLNSLVASQVGGPAIRLERGAVASLGAATLYRVGWAQSVPWLACDGASSLGLSAAVAPIASSLYGALADGCGGQSADVLPIPGFAKVDYVDHAWLVDEDLHLTPASPYFGGPWSPGGYLGFGFWYNDADFDGLPDGWEHTHFGDLAASGAADPDGDGLSNAQEYAAGTNPNLADTDGDGVHDGLDCAPLDPLVSTGC